MFLTNRNKNSFFILLLGVGTATFALMLRHRLSAVEVKLIHRLLLVHNAGPYFTDVIDGAFQPSVLNVKKGKQE
jgi:hypothetical protein